MMNIEFLQLNQISLAVFAVAALSVIREKNIFPYVLALVGSVLFGNFSAVLIAAFVFLYRIYFQPSRWVQLKDALAVFFILVGSAVPEPYQQFMMTVGVIGLSLNFGNTRLGLVPPLLLIHALFGDQINVEIVLGGAAGYLALTELVRLLKSKHERKILAGLEIPALVLILFPLQAYILKWIEQETLIWLGGAIALIAVSFSAWVKWKDPDFKSIYLKTQQRVARSSQYIATFFTDRRRWMKEAEPVTSYELDFYFDRLFYAVVLVSVAWAVVLFVKGGSA
jgi:hypothetical protein